MSVVDKKILSLDIGIKNLSYILISIPDNDDKSNIESSFSIIDWGILSIIDEKEKVKDFSFTEISDKLFSKLTTKFTDDYIKSIEYVILENQPVLKNPVMKSIQMMLYSYFYTLKYRNNYDKMILKLQSATLKIKVENYLLNYNDKDSVINEVNSKKKKLNYKETKDKGISLTTYILENNNLITNDNKELFNKSKKKDDLADCLLQGLYYAYNII